MIRIETHCHSAPASECAHITPEALVRGLAGRGYDALVLTNHYYKSRSRSPERLIADIKTDYQSAKIAGEMNGIRVFFGAELRFPGSKNDFLLYGLTADELFAMDDIFAGDLRAFLQKKPEHAVLYQAHPFRDGMTRTREDTALLDGIEVFNGLQSHDSHNELALDWAKTNGSRMISGSDTHSELGLARSGVYLPRMPESETDLASLLRDVTEDNLIYPGDL